MIRFLSVLVFFLVLLLSIGSCDEQNGKVYQNKNAESYRFDSSSISQQNETNLIPDSQNETALVPTIMRAPLPKKFSDFQFDTTQVSQYIRRIFQDRNGNLWFGTVGDGVCRYDGESLTYFTVQDGFSGNSVQDIAEDKAGNLWFGTSGGVSKYDGTNFINFTQKDGLYDNHVQSLFIDKFETVWVGTPKGVCRYNSSLKDEHEQGKYFSLFLSQVKSPKQVRNMMEDKDGKIWFATQAEGVYCYGSGVLIHYTEKEGLGKNSVRCILQDRKGIIWLATSGGGLSRYSPTNEFGWSSQLFTNYRDEKGSNEIERLYEDRAGKLWVSLRGGVRCYNSSPNNYQTHTSSHGKQFIAYASEDGLSNTNIQSIFEDKAGNIWFGSGAGLFRFDKSRIGHPCKKGSCTHDLQLENDLKNHLHELDKSFINVTKKGPWPKKFR